MLPAEFQKVLRTIGIAEVRYPEVIREKVFASDRSHPYIWSDMEGCIKCYRCVRAFDELQSEHVLGIMGRGIRSSIIRGYNERFVDSPCVTCGVCVQTCPANAISDRYSIKP